MQKILVVFSLAIVTLGISYDRGRPLVEVSDLAPNTDGHIITWTSSGDPTSIGPGTAGHVLVSGGAGAAPTFQQIAPMVVVVDEKAASTEGGTFTLGAWQTRDLNTIRVNDGTIASLASDQVTLPAGTYECWISAPAFRIGKHMVRLQDITDVSTIVTGTSSHSAAAGSYASTRSFIYHKFTLSVSSALEIQHRCVSTKTIDGFGVASGFGVVETYTVAMFRKLI